MSVFTKSDHMGQQSSEAPEWAVEHANTAFCCGEKVEAIERALVQKGLTPEQAVAAVDAALDREVAGSHRWFWISRIGSLFVAPAMVVLLSSGPQGGKPWSWILLAALSLLCIWFPHSLGSSFSPRGRVKRPTPAFFVAFGGWLLLLGVPLLVLALAR